MSHTPRAALPALAAALLLAACDAPLPVPATPATPSFPAPDRPVADIVSAAWSDEESRDNAGEAQAIFRRLALKPGMAVADIGAGSGYYTARLSPLLGPTGTVFANDIIPDYLARLKARAAREGLANVQFILGDAGNANLPDAQTDVALLVHMYHEIADPFALLWHLHDDLRPGGRVAIVDADRPTARHGTPPALLKCELEAAGFRQTDFTRTGNGSYLAVFAPAERPAPEEIRACRAG
jgi:SAM-dependent methyltransferase